MLVVISDLHFTEERSDTIASDGRRLEPMVRNLGPRAFEGFFDTLARQVVRDGARNVHLVLAGDIFDLHRTALWFEGPDRPWVPNGEVGAALEGRILKILGAIAAEKAVVGSLEAIRRFAGGRYLDPASGEERPFPVQTILSYIPGNHDRLCNATPALRRKTRELLGLTPGEEPFGHTVCSSLTSPPGDENVVLVRHGHEYDRYNFSRDLSRVKTVPDLKEDAYGRPTLGDFVTVAVASRLPVLFREVHGDARIVSSSRLGALYRRLLAFDDLRPQSALLEFLLAGAREMGGASQTWKALEPVLAHLLEEIHDDPYLRKWLKRLEKKWSPDAIDVLQAALDLQVWRAGVPLSWVRALMRLKGKIRGTGHPPEILAAREPNIRGGGLCFVVAGHTHHPAVRLLGVRSGKERYYIDTGTWRHRIPSNHDLTAFGSLKALTWVGIYGPGEDPGHGPAPVRGISFDYWSGFTQRWPVEG